MREHPRNRERLQSDTEREMWCERRKCVIGERRNRRNERESALAQVSHSKFAEHRDPVIGYVTLLVTYGAFSAHGAAL